MQGTFKTMNCITTNEQSCLATLKSTEQLNNTRNTQTGGSTIVRTRVSSSSSSGHVTTSHVM